MLSLARLSPRKYLLSRSISLSPPASIHSIGISSSLSPTILPWCFLRPPHSASFNLSEYLSSSKMVPGRPVGNYPSVLMCFMFHAYGVRGGLGLAAGLILFECFLFLCNSINWVGWAQMGGKGDMWGVHRLIGEERWKVNYCTWNSAEGRRQWVVG